MRRGLWQEVRIPGTPTTYARTHCSGDEGSRLEILAKVVIPSVARNPAVGRREERAFMRPSAPPDPSLTLGMTRSGTCAAVPQWPGRLASSRFVATYAVRLGGSAARRLSNDCDGVFEVAHRPFQHLRFWAARAARFDDHDVRDVRIGIFLVALDAAKLFVPALAVFLRLDRVEAGGVQTFGDGLHVVEKLMSPSAKRFVHPEAVAHCFTR